MKDKLIFKKTKIITGNIDTCCECAFDGTSFCPCPRDCSAFFVYKVEEGPQKNQSEYDWKKERYVRLSSLDLNILLTLQQREVKDELKSLKVWLEQNKPVKWEECTRENTKVGDTVRFKNDIDRKEVKMKYISDNNNICIYKMNNCNCTDDKGCIQDFEINTNKGDK